MSNFDSLGFAQKLREVGVPPQQAEAEAALIRDQVVARSATNGDLLNLEQRVGSRLDALDVKIDRVGERLRSEIQQLGQQMTIKIGGATVVAIGAITALQKLLEG